MFPVELWFLMVTRRAERGIAFGVGGRGERAAEDHARGRARRKPRFALGRRLAHQRRRSAGQRAQPAVAVLAAVSFWCAARGQRRRHLVRGAGPESGVGARFAHA